MMTFVLQNGWSSLHIASLKGHLDIVRALIEAGVNISQANKVGTVLVNQCHYTTSVLVSGKYVVQGLLLKINMVWFGLIYSVNFNSNS